MNLTNSDLYVFVVMKLIARGLSELFHLWDLCRNLPVSMCLVKDVVAPRFSKLCYRSML